MELLCVNYAATHASVIYWLFVWVKAIYNMEYTLVCIEWYSDPEVIKLLLMNKKVYLSLNVKMPQIVGLLIFISRIYKTFERFKVRKIFIFQHFSCYELLQFHSQLSWAWKKFYNLRAYLKWAFFIRKIIKYTYNMSRDMWFPTMLHFDKCKLRRACGASFNA